MQLESMEISERGRLWEFKDAGWWGDIIDDREFNNRVDDQRDKGEREING